MMSEAMARDLLARAGRCLREARTLFHEGDHALTVRRAQEAIELAVKALLRLVGIEFPREHDVSDVLVGSAGRFPEPWREVLPELARRMRELTPKRGPAMYGLEAQGIPASEAFDEEDGRGALADAEFVYSRCAAYFEDWKARRL
jgi:HEPN domain-containing protein